MCFLVLLRTIIFLHHNQHLSEEYHAHIFFFASFSINGQFNTQRKTDDRVMFFLRRTREMPIDTNYEFDSIKLISQFCGQRGKKKQQFLISTKKKNATIWTKLKNYDRAEGCRMI